jgi:hypothetical protein
LRSGVYRRLDAGLIDEPRYRISFSKAAQKRCGCPGTCSRIEIQIDPTARGEPDAILAWAKRFRRLAVEGHDPRGVAFQLEREAAIAGGIDQAQAQSLARPHRNIRSRCSVDQDQLPRERACLRGHPQYERDVAIDIDRFRLLDNERPMKAAVDLLGRMRVVPERAGVGWAKAVVKARTWRERGLGPGTVPS